jgi:hypothetical protein
VFRSCFLTALLFCLTRAFPPLSLLPDFTPLPNLFFLALGALELELTEAEQAAVPSPKARSRTSRRSITKSTTISVHGISSCFSSRPSSGFFCGVFCHNFFLSKKIKDVEGTEELRMYSYSLSIFPLFLCLSASL